MELDHLIEFALLTKIGNYQQTADQLFISQSTLSKHISNLEKELGSPLYKRTQRKIILTDFGRAFLKYAEEINDCHNRYVGELIAPSDICDHSISVGFVPSTIVDEMPNLVKFFKKDNPKCSLKISHFEYETAFEMFRNGELNIVIVPDSATTLSKEFNSVVSYDTDELVVILPHDHVLTHDNKIHITQLKNETFILLHNTSFIFHFVLDVCQKAGFSPMIDLRVKKVQMLLNSSKMEWAYL